MWALSEVTSAIDFGCHETTSTTNTSQALYDALNSSGNVCIKLLPRQYNLIELASAYDNDTWLPKINGDRRVAIVAEQGQATLNARGLRRHLDLGSESSTHKVLLYSLRLTNGSAKVRRVYSPRSTVRDGTTPCSHAPRPFAAPLDAAWHARLYYVRMFCALPCSLASHRRRSPFAS